MRKAIFTLTLLLASLQGFAQKEVGKLTFIPKVGVNLATIAGSDIYYHGNTELKPTMRVGVAAGIDGDYQFSESMSLSVGLLYSLQGHGYDDIERQKNYSATLHYVNVPIMLNYYIFKGLAVKAGLQPGYAFYKKLGYDQYFDNSWRSYTSSGTTYNSFDFGIPVGISYDFDKWRLDARYNFGLLNLNKLDEGGKYSNRVIQVTVGYCL